MKKMNIPTPLERAAIVQKLREQAYTQAYWEQVAALPHVPKELLERLKAGQVQGLFFEVVAVSDHQKALLDFIPELTEGLTPEAQAQVERNAQQAVLGHLDAFIAFLAKRKQEQMLLYLRELHGGMAQELVPTVGAQELEAFLQHKEGALLQFAAAWCAPCKEMIPIVEGLAKRYGDRVAIGRVDVDREKELAERYDVRGVPAFLFFKQGVLQERRLVGKQTEQALQELIDGGVQ